MCKAGEIQTSQLDPLIPETTRCSRVFWPDFADTVAEAQSGEVTCPKGATANFNPQIYLSLNTTRHFHSPPGPRVRRIVAMANISMRLPR